MFCPALVKGLPVQAIFLTPEPVRSITPWPFLKDSIFTWTFSLYLGHKQARIRSAGPGTLLCHLHASVIVWVFQAAHLAIYGVSLIFLKDFSWFLLKSLGFPRCAAVRFPQVSLVFFRDFPKSSVQQLEFPSHFARVSLRFSLQVPSNVLVILLLCRSFLLRVWVFVLASVHVFLCYRPTSKRQQF